MESLPCLRRAKLPDGATPFYEPGAILSSFMAGAGATVVQG
jgi:hypothetical protein